MLQPAGEAIAMENPTARGFHSQAQGHTPQVNTSISLKKFIFVNGQEKKKFKKIYPYMNGYRKFYNSFCT